MRVEKSGLPRIVVYRAQESVLFVAPYPKPAPYPKRTRQDSINDWGYLYVMGGDSFVKTTEVDPGERGGGYSNDVWVTEGYGWKMYSEGTKPMMKSTMQWDEVNPGRLPPAGLTYEDWIICQARMRKAGTDWGRPMQWRNI